MKKVLDILDSIQEVHCTEYANEKIEEAMEYIRNIQDKSCLNCQYFQNETLHKEEWQECSMFYIETRDIANVNKFYCSEHKYIICAKN